MMNNNGEFENRRVLSKHSIEIMLADGVGNATVPSDNFVSTCAAPPVTVSTGLAYGAKW